MSEVEPVSLASSTNVDLDAFGFQIVLTKVFQDILKKPEPDDDSDGVESVGAANEINRTIATSMAQVITGFGK